MLKALFVLDIFTFLFCLFGFIEKLSDREVNVSSKIYGVTDRTTNNYNTHIAQFVKKAMKFVQLIECNVTNTFL